jgi:hypothetical protein
MSDAKKCDTCEAFYDSKETEGFKLRIFDGENCLDLCAKCHWRLESIVARKKTDKKAVWTPEQREAAGNA